MNLSEGTKQIGRPFYIPNCPRESLAEFLKERDLKTGAEIGVYRGEYSESFCKAGLNIYAIDPWTGYIGAGRSEKKQEMQDTNFDLAKKRLFQYKNCTFVRKTSMEALADFPAESLDFVYIDGDHRFKYIAEDLSEWFLKVKHGGIVSGHDYFNTNPSANNVICHVGAVVDAFVKSYGIENFYTFGIDKTPSWMFFKP